MDLNIMTADIALWTKQIKDIVSKKLAGAKLQNNAFRQEIQDAVHATEHSLKFLNSIATRGVFETPQTIKRNILDLQEKLSSVTTLTGVFFPQPDIDSMTRTRHVVGVQAGKVPGQYVYVLQGVLTAGNTKMHLAHMPRSDALTSAQWCQVINFVFELDGCLQAGASTSIITFITPAEDVSYRTTASHDVAHRLVNPAQEGTCLFPLLNLSIGNVMIEFASPAGMAPFPLGKTPLHFENLPTARRCPLSSSSDTFFTCAGRTMSCIWHVISAAVLNTGAMYPQDIITWVEDHYPELSGVFYFGKTLLANMVRYLRSHFGHDIREQEHVYSQVLIGLEKEKNELTSNDLIDHYHPVLTFSDLDKKAEQLVHKAVCMWLGGPANENKSSAFLCHPLTIAIVHVLMDALQDTQCVWRHQIFVRSTGARYRLMRLISLLPYADYYSLMEFLQRLAVAFHDNQELICKYVGKDPRVPYDELSEKSTEARCVLPYESNAIVNFMAQCSANTQEHNVGLMDIRLVPPLSTSDDAYGFYISGPAHVNATVMIYTGCMIPGSHAIYNKVSTLRPKIMYKMYDNFSLVSKLCLERTLKTKNAVYKSAVLVVGAAYPRIVSMGVRLMQICPNALNRRVFKAVVVILSDPREWTLADIIAWLSQLAWAGSRPAWITDQHLEKMPSDLDIPRFCTDAAYRTDILTTHCGFSMLDVLFVQSSLSEYAFLTLPPSLTSSVTTLRQEATTASPTFRHLEQLAARGRILMHATQYGNASTTFKMAWDGVTRACRNGDTIPLDFQVTVISNFGLCMHHQGRYEEALSAHEKAHAIIIAADTPQSMLSDLARCYSNMALAHQNMGNAPLAVSLHLKVLDLCRNVTHNSIVEVITCGNLGTCYQHMGMYEEALAYHQEHIEHALVLGRSSSVVRAYANIGMVYQRMGRYMEAIAMQTKHSEAAKECGDVRAQAVAHGAIAECFMAMRVKAHALKHMTKYVELCKRHNLHSEKTLAMHQLAMAHYALGDFTQSKIWHEQHLLSQTEEKHDRMAQATAFVRLAHSLFSLGDKGKATDMLEFALQTYYSHVDFILEQQHKTNKQEHPAAAAAYPEYLSHLVNTAARTAGLCLQHYYVEQQKYDCALYTLERTRHYAMLVPPSAHALTLEVFFHSVLPSCVGTTFVVYSIIYEESLLYIWVVEKDGTIHFQEVEWNYSEKQLEEATAVFQRSMGATSACYSIPASSAALSLPDFLADCALQELLPHLASMGVKKTWQAQKMFELLSKGAADAVSLFPKASPLLLRRIEDYIQHRMTTTNSPAHDPVSADLYTRLISPIKAYLPADPDDLVVMIPCGDLFSLPFAALRSPSTRRFLIEEHTLSIAPSIAMYAQYARRCEQVNNARLSSLRREEAPLARAVQTAVVTPATHVLVLRFGPDSGAGADKDKKKTKRDVQPIIPTSGMMRTVQSPMASKVPCIIYPLWTARTSNVDISTLFLAAAQNEPINDRVTYAHILRQCMLDTIRRDVNTEWANFTCFGYPPSVKHAFRSPTEKHRLPDDEWDSFAK